MDDVKIKIDEREGRYTVGYIERVYGTIEIFARNLEEAKQKLRDGDYESDVDDSEGFEYNIDEMEFQEYVD